MHYINLGILPHNWNYPEKSISYRYEKNYTLTNQTWEIFM